MSDLLKKTEEVYKKWESRSNPNLGRRQPQFRNFNKRKPQEIVRSERKKFDGRKKYPSGIRMPQFRDLAQYKMVPSVNVLNRNRPFMGLCCNKCVPISRATMPQPYIPSLPIYNILVIPSGASSLPVIFESFIPFYFIFQRDSNFYYPDISYDIFENERYLSQLQIEPNSGNDSNLEDNNDENENRSTDSIDQMLETKTVARNMLSTMKASISPMFLRFSAWFLHKVLGSIFSSVQVHKGHIELLKASNQEDIPIVYIPMHRSHLDYILISFILFMNDLKVPLVAAGENLLIPVFAFIMRRLGAFFVRRHLDPDPWKKDFIYRGVLQTYVSECLKAGHSLEIFIEGGRSRNGMTRMPRMGLLSFVVESFIKGDIEDVLISPISISYEKLVEGNFIQEQLGKDKPTETFLSTIRSLWTLLHSRFGNVRVDFGQPFSLKEFLQKGDMKHIFSNHRVPSIDTPPSSPTSSSSGAGSVCGKGTSRKKLRAVIQNLANHITYDLTSSSALMCSQLVAFLLITKHRKGATHQQLLCSFDWLREELLKRKRDVGFTGESSSVIKYALQLLGKNLVITETREWAWWQASKMESSTLKFLTYTPIIELPFVIELQYYANSVVPIFFLDSVVINALYALLDADICYFHLCDSKFFVSRQDLINKTKDLCNIFQYEFLFTPPCSDITSAINDVIDELIAKDCLHVIGTVANLGSCLQKVLNRPKGAYAFASSDEEDDSYGGYNQSQQLKVDLSEESIDYLEFIRSIASPFIECYWVTACSLLKLVHTTMEESVFLKEIQRTAEDKLSDGLLHYEESFGMESLKNALKLFRRWEVLEYTYNKKDFRIYYILRQCTIEYSDIEHSDNEHDKNIETKVPIECEICTQSVSDLIEKIEEFRK